MSGFRVIGNHLVIKLFNREGKGERGREGEWEGGISPILKQSLPEDRGLLGKPVFRKLLNR